MDDAGRSDRVAGSALRRAIIIGLACGIVFVATLYIRARIVDALDYQSSFVRDNRSSIAGIVSSALHLFSRIDCSQRSTSSREE